MYRFVGLVSGVIVVNAEGSMEQCLRLFWVVEVDECLLVDPYGVVVTRVV